MTNILITGSNGLIGNSLILKLEKKEQLTVFGLGRKGLPNSCEIDLNTNWNENSLPEKVDIIIHLAQSELFRDFPNSAKEVFNVNTLSTLKLLEYARKSGVKKFIYASSGGVYGNSDKGFNEESPLQPNKELGFYLTTKFCSELLVQNYCSFFDVNVLRFFFVFGEKQRKNMLLPRLIESVRSERTIVLQGKGGIKINPIYVEDATNAIMKIIEKKGSFNVNIGGNEILSIKQISEHIGRFLNKTPIFEYQDTEAKNLIGDISKMKELYTPQISFEEALKKMI
ncbi:MAG: NAD(P)-dependent oxidoreductase [Bacteroidetes bacterium]|nr:NAD(P)-dependent oxidoreductase [Bacteroidota bacterium]